MHSPGPKHKNAFSLVEVSLALAIIGIAFVALLGILPMGMRTFKAANETTVDARILGVMSSMLQSTEYSQLIGAGGIEENEFYFDVDGEYLDSKKKKGTAPVVAQRLYKARVVVDKQSVPASATAELTYDKTKVGSRVLLISMKMDEKHATDFESITGNPNNWSTDVNSLLKKGIVKVRPLILARFEGYAN